MIVNRIYPSYFCGLLQGLWKGRTSGNEPATLGGNESQERVCICFTNGPEHKARARRAAINANVILWHDQMIFRCRVRHHGTMSLRFASPFGKQRRAHRLPPLTASPIPLWQLARFFGGGKKERKKKEDDKCGYRWSTFFSVSIRW